MPDYTSSSYVQEPANSFRLTKADILANKRRRERKELEDLDNAPPMSPMAREEMADVYTNDRVSQIVQDPRNRAILAQTNPDYQRKFMEEANYANQANRAEVMRRKQLRDISSRDLAWQTAQADKAFERSQAERLWARDERRYKDERSDKAKALERQAEIDKYNKQMDALRYGDEYTKAAILDQMEGGGASAPSSFVDAARNELVGPGVSSGPMMGPSAGPMAPSTTPSSASMSPRMRALQQKMDEDRKQREFERNTQNALLQEKLADLQEGRAARHEDFQFKIDERERQKKIETARILMQSPDPIIKNQGYQLMAELNDVQGLDMKRMMDADFRQQDIQRFQSDPIVNASLQNIATAIAENISRPGAFMGMFSNASLAPEASAAIRTSVSNLLNQLEGIQADPATLSTLIEARVLGMLAQDTADLSTEERNAIQKQVRSILQSSMQPVSGRGFMRVEEGQQPSRF